MTEVLAFNDDEITKAFVKPTVPYKVSKLFDFLEENQNLITTAGGMQHHMTGLDRSKLVPLAQGYNINLFKWMFAVRMFETGLLEKHNQKDE